MATTPDFAAMAQDCRRLRRQIVTMIHGACSGHTGGSLSCVEILWTLYTTVLRVRPTQPDWPDRDRFVLSKGHAAPALYAVLAAKGFFDAALLGTLRQAGSSLQGHPDMRRTPGVEMSTGSLGMGISVGVGMALGARLARRDARVYVLVGDGELQEGQNWESLAAAHKFGLSNLTVIIDRNGVQLDGRTDEVMPMLDIAAKIAAFGLETRTCDGHDCGSVHAALSWACDRSARSARVIVANTVKGKGVSFMEGQAAWHGKPIAAEDYRLAMAELGGTD